MAIKKCNKKGSLFTTTNMLAQYAGTTFMSFNPSKCQMLHVTRLNTPIPSNYSVHNTEQESVSAAKYLGVTISDDLNWGTHIDNITKKANQTLGFLKRNIKVHKEDLRCGT